MPGLCKSVPSRGRTAGQMCLAKVAEGSEYCSKHTKAMSKDVDDVGSLSDGLADIDFDKDEMDEDNGGAPATGGSAVSDDPNALFIQQLKDENERLSKLADERRAINIQQGVALNEWRTLADVPGGTRLGAALWVTMALTGLATAQEGQCMWRGDADGHVVIPNNVTAIPPGAFFKCPLGCNVRTISIPDSVLSIGDGAFEYCTTVTVVIMPASVTSVGNNTFWGGRTFSGCTSLRTVSIPDSVTSIGYGIFQGCSSLVNVTISDSVTYIGELAFSGCSALPNFVFPRRLSSIGLYAFQGCCASVTSVSIPSSVTSMAEAVFQYCTGLEHAIIPDSISSLPPYSFSQCPALRSVSIADSVTAIGVNAFELCTSLNTLRIPSGVTAIANGTFSATALERVVIPANVTSIGDFAFGVCTALRSVTIPNSVTSIGRMAFQGCAALASLYLPSGLTAIGDCSFCSCSSLVSIDIPSGVKSIGTSAFQNCSSLKFVSIPDSVVSIGTSAFAQCSSLSHVSLPDSVTSVGPGAFSVCSSLQTISIPSGASFDSRAFSDSACPVDSYVPGTGLINCTVAAPKNYSCARSGGCAPVKNATGNVTKGEPFGKCLARVAVTRGDCSATTFECRVLPDGIPACVSSNKSGVSRASCEAGCLPDSDTARFICAGTGGDAVCQLSLTGQGISKIDCISSCEGNATWPVRLG